MIVLVDTNAFHRDVYAVGQGLTTLFRACETGQLVGAEVWTPRAVVEELVRQFPERLAALEKSLKRLDYHLSAFRLRPELPASDAAGVVGYRDALTQKLTGRGRRVVDHPTTSATVIEWAAQRRHPIKEYEPPPDPESKQEEPQRSKTRPVYGVVDAAIWLTIIEAASTNDVALISANVNDFADPDDHAALHPQLIEDLRAAGVDPTRVARYESITAFNQQHIAPLQEALDAANNLLSDAALSEVLRTEISDHVSWIPLHETSDWDLEADIDDAHMSGFDPAGLELVRADPATDGFFATLWVDGTAQLDLGLRKGDAAGLSDQSPIVVTDWDYNESMVSAVAELDARLLVEIEVKVLDADEGRYDFAEVSIQDYEIG